ncbi:Cytochrome c oxidase copper chaperone [Paramecium bursaria]
MDQQPKKCTKGGPCCKCAPVRRIMNFCIQNNGEENCQTFRNSWKECIDYYKQQ